MNARSAAAAWGRGDAWEPSSWRAYPAEQQPDWEDQEELEGALAELRALPPLIFAGEARTLMRALAAAARGEAFVLQAGDCAENLHEYSAEAVLARLRLLLDLAVVISYAVGKPVLKIGRVAGQFAKPRTSPTESRRGVVLPAFRGHAVNDASFDRAARRADPRRLLRVYDHAMAKLNLIRAATSAESADLQSGERWRRELAACSLQDQRFRTLAQSFERAMRFASVFGADPTAWTRLPGNGFYTSHEALLLGLEEALTRFDPATSDWYCCSAHFLWLGERTRRLDGAHAIFLSGVGNPIGVKLGPRATPDEVVALCDLLDARREPGRLSFITRMGAREIESVLPPVVRAVRDRGREVVWICDPMHGNTWTTPSGVKTRSLEDIVSELRSFFGIQHQEGVPAGGIHLELTPDEVSECVGFGEGGREASLSGRYLTLCDPRLNPRQCLQLALELIDIAGRGSH